MLPLNTYYVRCVCHFVIKFYNRYVIGTDHQVPTGWHVRPTWPNILTCVKSPVVLCKGGGTQYTMRGTVNRSSRLTRQTPTVPSFVLP